jgi:hypothetical protein
VYSILAACHAQGPGDAGRMGKLEAWNSSTAQHGTQWAPRVIVLHSSVLAVAEPSSRLDWRQHVFILLVTACVVARRCMRVSAIIICIIVIIIISDNKDSREQHVLASI